MPVYVVTRRNKAGEVVSYHVRWSRSRRTLPGSDVVHLGRFKLKKAAEDRRDEAEQIVARGGEPSLAFFDRRDVVTMGLAELREDWLSTVRDRSPLTTKNQVTFSAEFVERWGHLRPSEITVGDVRAWVKDELARGAAGNRGKGNRAGVLNKLNTLGPLLDHADLAHPNPARHRTVKGSLPRKVKTMKVLPTLADIGKVRDQLAPRHLIGLDILLHGGLRHEGMISLDWQQVDHKAKCLRGVFEKGRYRDVEWLPFQPMWLPVRPSGEGPDDKIIGRAEKGGPMNKQAFARILLTACEEAGVTPFSPKVLRDHHASWLMAEDGHLHHLSWGGASDRLGNSVPVLQAAYTQTIRPEAESDEALPDWFRPSS